MAFDPSAYRITVQRENVDGESYHVGTVMELPDVVVYEDSHNKAYSALLKVIADLKSAADDDGRTFPEPRPRTSEYSGRLTVRLPQHLHRKVAIQAEYEDISINQFVATAIAECVGEMSAPKLFISTLNILTTVASTGGESYPLSNMQNLMLFGAPQLTAVSQARNLENV